jgi:uncharacterized protein YcbX
MSAETSALQSVRAGTVVALWRYPVKSMMGAELNASHADLRGLLGDRAYALVDEATGKVASAKNPRLWARLFDCRAAFVEPPEPGHPLPPIRITLPEGRTVRSDEPGVDKELSEVLGRRVRLAPSAPERACFEEYWPDLEGLSPEEHRDTVTEFPLAEAAAPGTFFDVTAFHLLTTQTIDALRRAYPDGRVEPRRFRPNVVVRAEGSLKGFVENDWVGRVLGIGPGLKIKVLIPTMRCVMTTLAQDDLPGDPEILRATVRANRVPVRDRGRYPCVGVYGSLARQLSSGGEIRRGDPVTLE